MKFESPGEFRKVVSKIVQNHNCALIAKSQGDSNMAHFFAGQRNAMEELIGRQVVKEMMGDYRSNVPTNVTEEFIRKEGI